MKNIRQEYYDGEFDYNGHMIKYHIGNEFKNKKYDNHGQLVKELRYIDFIEWDALDLYKKMCEMGEDKHDR